MAKLVRAKIAGEGDRTVFVNLDQVRYVLPQSQNKVLVHFDANHTLLVEVDIAAMVLQTRGPGGAGSA